MKNIKTQNSALLIIPLILVVTSFIPVGRNSKIDQIRISTNSKNLSEPFTEFTKVSAEYLRDGDRIKLTWSVLSVDNIDYFIIEKSNNGKQFEKLATISSDESKLNNNEFCFYDNASQIYSSIYRITQVDKKGAYGLSLDLNLKRIQD
ncbi:hypothetical protein [Chondrinema litorale]|uniref:hypothetical protein n=1 Tax=Chondrinema litorale TaxID=2994555 RepID=UPI002542E8C9|nr:hypothetical protein [Chondrinema litorale]UZR98385.1 hypothetical protein OQ292_30775 [Chondrinema litorale]